MSTLAGTAALVRLIVRRDRLRLAIWIGAVVVVTVATAAALAKLFPSAESRALFATGITGNPAILALIGPLFDATTIGGLIAWRLGGIGAVVVALVSLLTVVRHTRAEEEAGRRELLGSAAVGRHAPLAAALLVIGAADLLVAVLVAGGLVACGLPTAGAIAMGLSFACAGWTFAAIAAIAAQLVETARAANTIAGAILGLAYLARAVGDAEPGLWWLSWALPIGWAQRIRPFAGERWWLCGFAAAVAVALATAAQTLSARRDLGAGVVRPRPGAATASRWLAGAFGLAWRLQRSALTGWTIGFAVVGTALGSIAHGVPDLLNSVPRIRVLVAALGGPGALVDAYFTATFGILGVVASGYGVQATLRLRGEEEDARAELVLSAAVSRLRWATSHLVFAAFGPAIALAAAGVTAGLVHAEHEVPRLVATALVQLPAVWVLVGIALALVGVAPRFAPASWGVLAGCLVLGQLGQLLQLPSWAMSLSPFTHLPKPLGGGIDAAPLLLLVGAASAFAIAGLLALRRRDLG